MKLSKANRTTARLCVGQFWAALCCAALAAGCGQAEKGATAKSEAAKAPAPAATAAAEKPGHKHDGWWCDEHGVPEEICGLCNSKVAAEMQKHGDWCKEHDRPDSQCFVCHPDYEAKFADRYEAKYGKRPPKPEG